MMEDLVYNVNCNTAQNRTVPPDGIIRMKVAVEIYRPICGNKYKNSRTINPTPLGCPGGSVAMTFILIALIVLMLFTGNYPTPQ
jgi:hypothetical protein